MARYIVDSATTSRIAQAGGGTAPVTTVVLWLDSGGTAATSIRVTGPAGSQIASMTVGQRYDINKNTGGTGRYKVNGGNFSEVTSQSGTSVVYAAGLIPVSNGTAAQVIRFTGPAGSQIQSEMQAYGQQFDITAV